MEIIPGLLSMIFWGVAIFLAAIVSRKIGNILTLFWMQLSGFLVGAVYFILNFNSFNLAQLPKFIPILIVIAVLQIIAYLSFYKGTEKGQVSLVGPLGAAWGLVVALMGVVLYRETLSGTQIGAISLILVGILLIAIDLETILKSKKLKILTGFKEGVLAMLGWGISLSLLVYPTKNINWFLPAFVFRFFLIILLGSYMVIKRSVVPQVKQLPLGSLVTIGAFDMGAFMSLSYGVSSTKSAIIAPIASAYIVVTVLLAKIFLKEKSKLSQSLGITAVVLGIILVSL